MDLKRPHGDSFRHSLIQECLCLSLFLVFLFPECTASFPALLLWEGSQQLQERKSLSLPLGLLDVPGLILTGLILVRCSSLNQLVAGDGLG